MKWQTIVLLFLFLSHYTWGQTLNTFQCNRSSWENYQRYSRPKKLAIVVDGYSVGVVFLEYTPKFQLIQFEDCFELRDDKQINVEVKVLEIYEGKEKAYGIAELMSDGIGGHSMTYKMCRKE